MASTQGQKWGRPTEDFQQLAQLYYGGGKLGGGTISGEPTPQ